MKNLGKKLKTAFLIGFGGLIFYSLSEEKINEFKFGKEYVILRDSIDSRFSSSLDSLQNAYKIQHQFDINNPNHEALKADYQRKEEKLTQDWYNKREELRISIKK